VVHLDAQTGQARLEEAILDVATSHPQSGASLYLDVVVSTAHSDNQAKLAQRARADGRAASDAAAGKRRRYAEAGAALWPLSFEAGGRAADEAAAFVRQCGAAWAHDRATEDGDAPAAHTDLLWREVNTLLLRGTADMLLSAVGA